MVVARKMHNRCHGLRKARGVKGTPPLTTLSQKSHNSHESGLVALSNRIPTLESGKSVRRNTHSARRVALSFTGSAKKLT